MEWWGELVGILERRAGPVMHALTFVELNGINLAPLLRRFTSLTLLSTPTSLILETRLHKYSPEVQEGLLTLVLAQLRRLPAALVVDFVLAYADAQPSPMRREWPRRLVSRICQQLRALDSAGVLREPTSHRLCSPSAAQPRLINLLVYNLPSSTHKMARARSGSFSEQMMDMEEVLVSEGAIEARVRQLAEQINKEYKGKSIVVIGILKGSVMFMTDLVKRLHVDAKIEFMAVSSYGSSTVSSGAVKIVMDTRTSIEGQHVVVVEDIVDSGYTMRYLKNLLLSRKPASLEICVLLEKPSRLKVAPEELGIKYTGFEIPDKWVVGYGMDYDERYRCLPFIGVLKRSVYDSTFVVEAEATNSQ